MKQTQKAVAAGDENAKSLLDQTLKALDKAGQKGVLKENTKDRKKSKLHRLFNKEMGEQKNK